MANRNKQFLIDSLIFVGIAVTSYHVTKAVLDLVLPQQLPTRQQQIERKETVNGTATQAKYDLIMNYRKQVAQESKEYWDTVDNAVTTINRPCRILNDENYTIDCN